MKAQRGQPCMIGGVEGGGITFRFHGAPYTAFFLQNDESPVLHPSFTADG